MPHGSDLTPRPALLRGEPLGRWTGHGERAGSARRAHGECTRSAYSGITSRGASRSAITR